MCASVRLWAKQSRRGIRHASTKSHRLDIGETTRLNSPAAQADIPPRHGSAVEEDCSPAGADGPNPFCELLILATWRIGPLRGENGLQKKVRSSRRNQERVDNIAEALVSPSALLFITSLIQRSIIPSLVVRQQGAQPGEVLREILGV